MYLPTSYRPGCRSHAMVRIGAAQRLDLAEVQLTLITQPLRHGA
ncbi:MAG: hypothetical protein ACK5YJ_03180 [Curvibacter sp.]|jgi:hypothetical protein